MNKMVSKRFSVVVCVMLILGVSLLQTPPVIAEEKYEKFLGKSFDTSIIYSTHLEEHVIASGFGADISIMAPVEPKESTFTKVACAIELGESWTQYWLNPPFLGGYVTCVPKLGNMWIKVLGDSYFWPSPNKIVDNTGTGDECTLSWEDLLRELMIILVGLIFKLRETPPSQEWETNAHWLKAIVRQGPFDPDNRLQTAGSNFYSYFDQKGYNTLTITAGADVLLWVYGYDVNGIFHSEIYETVGYSLDFQVSVPVTNAPYPPSTPSGVTDGHTYTTYNYSTSTTDPNEDNVRYEFDWGDGTTTTTGWYASGLTATASHSWSSPGAYYVKVRAQDVYEEWSGWSEVNEVRVNYTPPVGVGGIQFLVNKFELLAPYILVSVVSVASVVSVVLFKRRKKEG